MATVPEPLPDGSAVDRFSSLPNETAHHILSLLSFKDVTRVGCVSKRCRGLHLSAPSINFSEFSDVNNMSVCEVRQQLLNSFDRFLNQRGDTKMQCFRFHWSEHYVADFADEDGISLCYCDEQKVRLDPWVDYAVRCNVELVELVQTSPEWFQRPPSSLFLSECLRSLTVHMNGRIHKVTSSLSNIECLKLKNVEINTKAEFWKWVSHCCKCLKELHLENVSGSDIVIESSSLVKFSVKAGLFTPRRRPCKVNISGGRLEVIIINCSHQSSDNPITISAPNLKYLKWDDRSFASSQDKESVSGLLCHISQVKVLVLSEHVFKGLLKKDFLSVQFLCLHMLRLTSLILTDDLIHSLVTLLGVSPNLSVLQMKSMFASNYDVTNCTGFGMEFWKSHNLGFVNKIKNVDLDVFHGSNVLEFARFILESAQNLEKMDIYYFPNQLDDVTKIQTQKVSNAAVFLHEVKQHSIFDLFDLSLG